MKYEIIEIEAIFGEVTFNFAIQEDDQYTVDRFVTREEAEETLVAIKHSDNIAECIEKALDELESRLCNKFGLNDIEDARKEIKDYTSFGYY